MQSSLFTKLAFAAILVFLATRVPTEVFATTTAAVTPAYSPAGTVAAPEPILGEIRMFAGNYAPRGFALCNGQTLSISEYPALYSLLGIAYGGDGRTTFGLPDLRGRAPVHAGQSAGPGLQERRVGEQWGLDRITLNTAQLPAHSHEAAVTINAGIVNSESTGSAAERVLASSRRQEPRMYTTAAADTPLRRDAATASVGNTGNSQPIAIAQPSLGVNFIIAIEGAFPLR